MFYLITGSFLLFNFVLPCICVFRRKSSVGLSLEFRIFLKSQQQKLITGVINRFALLLMLNCGNGHTFLLGASHKVLMCVREKEVI